MNNIDGSGKYNGRIQVCTQSFLQPSVWVSRVVFGEIILSSLSRFCALSLLSSLDYCYVFFLFFVCLFDSESHYVIGLAFNSGSS